MAIKMKVFCGCSRSLFVCLFVCSNPHFVTVDMTVDATSHNVRRDVKHFVHAFYLASYNCSGLNFSTRECECSLCGFYLSDVKTDPNRSSQRCLHLCEGPQPPQRHEEVLIAAFKPLSHKTLLPLRAPCFLCQRLFR